MAIVAADWTISGTNIRYIGDDHDGASPSYATVIELHRWVQDLADDAVWSGDDEMDITLSTPSERSTDNIIKLINGYNLDAKAIEHLYDGSITQGSGPTEEIWDGIVNFGNATVIIQVMQDGKVLADDFWNQSGPAGLNADAAAGISHRFMVKTRDQGVDIDGRRLIGTSRTFGNTYGEFKINGTSRGNNVLALSDSTDLNNGTAKATVAGWTDVTNTEGLRLIDISGDGTDEEYYSEWNRGTRTINQFYERGKFLTANDNTEDSNADTGSTFQVGNATIVGQAQSFTVGGNAVYATEASFWLSRVGSPTGDLTAVIYAHSGTYGSSSVPTGGALATSDPIAAADIDGANGKVTFRFPSPTLLTASTNYVVAIEKVAGDGSNHILVQGLASSGTHGGNRSQDTGAWAATAGDDLRFEVGSSPQLNGLPGIWFRGLTHSFAYDGETGTPPTTNDEIVWGTAIAYNAESGGTGTWEVGEAIHEDTATPVWKGRVIAVDDNGTTGTLIVAIESGTVTTAETFTGQTSGTGATVNGTPTAVTGGGRLKVFAFDDDGLVGNVYVQLLNGPAPTDNTILYDDLDVANNITINGSVTERTVSTPFVGVSTGSALIGAYGLGMEAADTSASDRFFDLGDNQIIPPNNVQFDVFGLEPSEDRVLVTNDQATGIDFDQLTLNTTLSGATETAVVCTASIPSDTPSSGTIRIQLDDGRYRLVSYTSFTSATFTIPSTDFSGANQATQPRNVFISYLDKLAGLATESFSVVYNADRTMFVRVRDGGGTPIKTFQTTATLGSTGGSATAIRTSDE